MKFSLPLTLLAIATLVDAATVQAEDKRWCSLQGQPCDTVKRAADAFADAMKTASGIVTRDESSSETSNIARRQLDELALIIAASQHNPAAFYNALHHGQPGPGADIQTTEKRDAEAQSWCRLWFGQSCWKRNFHPDTTPSKRDADADADADPQSWCQLWTGQPCWKRRSGTETAEVSKRDADAEAQSWCQLWPGQSCWKRDIAAEKRAASPQFCSRFVGSSCWKRDGGAEAAEDHKRCTSEGQSCWKARRAAEAVIAAIDAGNSAQAQFQTRDAEAQAWCRLWPGQSCWKRAATADAACNGPAGECTKATRDLHAMYNAAKAIMEAKGH